MILTDVTTKNAGDAYVMPLNSGRISDFKERYGSEEAWIAQNLRYIASNWNRRGTPYSHVSTDSVPSKYSTPVDEIVQNYKYYLGIQDDVPYAYLAEWSEGNEYPAPFTKGDEIFTVVQHMLGQFVKMNNSSNITIESLDPSVITEKEQVIQGLRLKKALPELFLEMAKAGVHYVPEGRFGGSADVDIEDAARRPIHSIERYGLDLIRHIENTNRSREFWPSRFKDALIGRHAATHVTTRSGRIFFEPIKPFYIIKDVSITDDDQNTYSPFMGYMWKGTVEQVAQRYDLSPEEESMCRDMLSGSQSQMFGPLNIFPPQMGGTNFAWFDENDLYGAKRITCITSDWVVCKRGRDGWKNTRYKGTLIGGKILVDYGEVDNVVYDKSDPSFPLSEIKVYSPDTTIGENRAPVDRFRKIQDDLDACMLQIRKMMSRDLGMTYAINGNKLGGMTTRELVEDLKSHGITVVNPATGEESVPSDNVRLVEQIDMRLDQNIIRYAELFKMREQAMRDVVSQSRITTGMQTTYVGGGTQRASIDQASNGTISYYDGFMQFKVNVMEYALNVAKTSLLDVSNEEEASVVFDGAAKRFWEAMKGVNISDLQVRIDIEDIIDDALRQRLDSIALAMAQNADKTGFTMLDYIELQKARTLSELKILFSEKLVKIKDEQDKQKLEAMMLQVMEAERQRTAQAELQKQKDSASMQREVVRQFPDMQRQRMEEEQAAQQQPQPQV